MIHLPDHYAITDYQSIAMRIGLVFPNKDKKDKAVHLGLAYLVDNMHDYHARRPRIVFETPEFPYADRLTAIAMAQKAGYYWETNEKSYVLDWGRGLAKSLQRNLPLYWANLGFLVMKRIYRSFR